MMKRILYLLLGCLIIVPLILTACSEPAPAEPAPTEAEILAIKDEIAERGSGSAFTLAAAEAAAGFPIGVPQYLPDGFYRQERIVINQLGGGLPAEMQHGNRPIMVDTYYLSEADENIMFFIEQSNGNPGIAGAEPVQLCGGEGERGYQPADPKRKYPSEILTLGRRIGDYHFLVYATLAGPLDEAEIEKIFCSIEYSE
jgi:hypothetical protein